MYTDHGRLDVIQFRDSAPAYTLNIPKSSVVTSADTSAVHEDNPSKVVLKPKKSISKVHDDDISCLTSQSKHSKHALKVLSLSDSEVDSDHDESKDLVDIDEKKQDVEDDNVELDIREISNNIASESMRSANDHDISDDSDEDAYGIVKSRVSILISLV